MTKAIFIVNPLGPNPQTLSLEIDPNLKQMEVIEVSNILYEVRKVTPESRSFTLTGTDSLQEGVRTYELMPAYL